jgi:4-amino-4-deoxy-L-arabinose transferase-like glycosyltransferase
MTTAQAELQTNHLSKLAVRLRGWLDRWSILLLVLAISYGVVLSFNLTNMAVQWDEVNHLTGGLLLTRGDLWNYFLTSSFYPPMYNLAAAAYFVVGGTSVFAVRLVALTFAVLSIIAVFQLTKLMYGSKTALLASALLAVTPGFIWLSRIALIETMLIFVFLVCMLYFFKWILTDQKPDLTIYIVAFLIGAATKYQMIVLVPLMVLFGMFVFGKKEFLKTEILRVFKMPRLIATVILSVIAVFAVIELYIYGYIDVMLYAIQTGTAQRALSSVTYPAPIFYLVETTASTGGVHPVILPLYLVGLAGLGLLLFRRKTPDKFVLIWFVVVYGVFSVVPNKEWRYIVLLFPALAISSAALMQAALGKLQKVWQLPKINVTKKGLVKVGAGVLVGFMLVGVFFSCVEAQTWLAASPPALPIEQATTYTQTLLTSNATVAVACPINLLNNYLVWFYLTQKAPYPNTVWQYPQQAADAYKPDFNTTEFTLFCEQNNTQIVLLYEYNENTYFESNLTAAQVSNMLIATHRFTLEAEFGTAPNRIFVFAFQ